MKKSEKTGLKMGVLAIVLFLTIFLAPGIEMLIRKGCASEIADITDIDEGQMEMELPKVEISLKSVKLEEIWNGSKETKYGGNTVKLVTSTGETTEFTDVEIKGRGNSTWQREKSPYQIKFAKKTDVFSLGRAKKWILLANYFDESFLRGDMAFRLAEMLEEEYATTGEFVEFVVDGESQGLYYLVRKIEVGTNSVNLHDPLGVVVELDDLHSPIEECYFSGFGRCLMVKDLVRDDYEIPAIHDFLTTFNEMEIAAEAGDFARVVELIDIDSFAKYYLISEFSANPDAYSSSFYFFKNGADDKIHAGPAWDYDFAFANKRWTWRDDDLILDPEESEVVLWNKEKTNFFYALSQMPEFKERVQEIFREKLSGREDELLEYFDEKKAEIFRAAMIDQAIWPNNYEKEFPEAVFWLREFIERRFEFFEKIFRGGV